MQCAVWVCVCPCVCSVLCGCVCMCVCKCAVCTVGYVWVCMRCVPVYTCVRVPCMHVHCVCVCVGWSVSTCSGRRSPEPRQLWFVTTDYGSFLHRPHRQAGWEWNGTCDPRTLADTAQGPWCPQSPRHAQVLHQCYLSRGHLSPDSHVSTAARTQAPPQCGDWCWMMSSPGTSVQLSKCELWTDR